MRYDAAFEGTKLLEEAVKSLDPALLDGASAADLVEVFSKAERVAAAGKALAAGRVASSGVWRGSGERSAAHWVAKKTGVAVGSAVGVIETATKLAELPQVDQAVRSGKLSEAQAREVASAAAASPAAEGELLSLAERESLNGLKSRCAQVRAAAVEDEADRYARIRSRRRVRHWSDPDGAFRMDLSTTPDAGAELLAALSPLIIELEKEAKAQGRSESYEALGADALVAMASHMRDCGESPERKGPGAMVHVLVDAAALERGYTTEGERSEISGVGPVPVATATALMADSILSVLSKSGRDLKEVSSNTRTIPSRVRTALQGSGRRCAVPGCGAVHNLQIDHDDPFALSRLTKFENLGWLCPYHHYLKTYRGFGFIGPPDERVWGKLDQRPPPDTS